jgi:hypothetical protein
MSFLIPFKGKNPSGKSADNILFQEKNIYIMDNHRLALWCWFQQIEKDESYNLFHIDAHPDMAVSANNIFAQNKINLWDLSLHDYQTAMQSEFNIPLFRWDNYIQVLLKFYPTTVSKENTYSATHKVGSIESLENDINAYRLLSELNGILSGQKFINNNKWIINLDLDYFFSSLPEKMQMFSSEYIEAVALAIKLGIDSGLIKVFTIALSPECCGGWEKTEATLAIFTKNLNITDKLLYEKKS